MYVAKKNSLQMFTFDKNTLYSKMNKAKDLTKIQRNI